MMMMVIRTRIVVNYCDIIPDWTIVTPCVYRYYIESYDEFVYTIAIYYINATPRSDLCHTATQIADFDALSVSATLLNIGCTRVAADLRSQVNDFSVHTLFCSDDLIALKIHYTT